MNEASRGGEGRYDAVPYDSRPFHATTPDNLAVVATFAGISAAAPDRCRVLELGCASGGNLIPLAVSFPEATFVGIDASAAQIAEGQRTAAALGLQNLTLVTRDVAELDAECGTFDYVIAHGLYSWVAPAVQDRMFALYRECLAPSGIGYVSYNTLPGWHLRGMVRDMMLYRVRGLETPAEQIAASRSFLEFLVASARGRDSAFTRFLAEEAVMLSQAGDAYLFHEHLELENHPVYFHEFVGRARVHGLEYVGEASPSTIRPGEFPDEVDDTVRRLARDVVEFEQYLDFLRNRTFRRSLLCHAEVPVYRNWSAEHLRSFWIGSRLHPAAGALDLDGATPVTFEGAGPRVTVDDPWLKTCLWLLGEHWPEVLHYGDLEARVAERLRATVTPAHGARLLNALLRCYVGGVLELHVRPARLARLAGPRPLASPLARLQAERGTRVFNLRHRVVDIREIDRHVVRLLDGTRERGAVADALERGAGAGELTLDRDAIEVVEESVAVLAKSALLLA